MKICFITATMAGGGAERVIANLANNMVAKGHSVNIVMTASDVVAYPLDPSIEVVSFGGRVKRKIWDRIMRICELRKYLKRNQEACFISMPTDTNLYVIIASLGLKLNLTVSERNDPNEYEHKFARNMLYCFVNRFVFQTEAAKNCFSKRIQNKGKIIANPLDAGRFPEVTDIGSKNKIVAVGRLEEQKNHKLLIEAFADFAQVYPNYQLVIYGQGSLLQKLTEYAGSMNVGEKVVFAGFSSNVLRDISDAKMYVLSSDYEGISNSLLEAMGLGLPVVSTRCPIGGSEMLIEDGVNGLLVPIKDAPALSKAMQAIAGNTELADKFSKNAKKCREIYSIDAICNQWLEVITEPEG